MIVVEGRVFLENGLKTCCVGIEEGRIVAIKKVLKGDERLDFGDDLILPGCIDAHVHFREPGKTHKEDFNTGSTAAAFGGVTCVLDMPNNLPPVNDARSLADKLELVKPKANVDFGLYTALVRLEGLEALSEIATGFKVYLARTTDASGIALGSSDLGALLPRASRNRPVSIHCEDEGLIKAIEEKDLEDHLAARPDAAEARAMEAVLDVSRKAKCKAHIAHVSSREGVALLEGARGRTDITSEVAHVTSEGAHITSEVTLSHMLLSAGSDIGAFGKVNPPLRRREDCEALREAFARGTIDILVSDHAPHTIEEKSESFQLAPSGIPGVETNVPIMLSLLKRQFVTLDRFVAATSALPARIFGLNKGSISVGRDADFIVVDLKETCELRTDMLHSKCAWTPFEGREVIFPRAVILGGKLAVKDDCLMNERMGRFVGGPPAPAQAPM